MEIINFRTTEAFAVLLTSIMLKAINNSLEEEVHDSEQQELNSSKLLSTLQMIMPVYAHHLY